MRVLVALLLMGMLTTASAEVLTISHSDWVHQPILKRYLVTVEVQYIPRRPRGDAMRETMQPVGYIERLYCNENPNYSSRCSNPDGDKWRLVMGFTAEGPRRYSVRRSTGMPVLGDTDTKEDIPYGIGTHLYYITTRDEESTGSFTVSASATNTSGDLLVNAGDLLIDAPR